MSLFRVQEHTLTTSHIREYPGATADGLDDELKLAIKQYTPLDNQDPKPGDVTIIGGHANGFPKVRRSHGGRVHASNKHIKFPTGTLRATVGRVAPETQGEEYQNSRNLDRRRLAPRCQRGD